jgi:5-methylcytosine-specific restriction endonuclease McrA
MWLRNMPEGLCSEAREAIDLRLRGGHWGCDNDIALLTRRVNRGGALNIQMQCTECGHAVGNALRVEQHPQFRSYPEWDEDRREVHQNASRERALAALAAYREAVEAKMLERVANKDEFYASGAWRWMRERVMRRAEYKCEACSHRDAQTVHHTTYRYGLRAPLYTLIALCHVCHRRMHTRGDEWHDENLPAHYTRDAAE